MEYKNMNKWCTTVEKCYFDINLRGELKAEAPVPHQGS
jgi:hypothetical protein